MKKTIKIIAIVFISLLLILLAFVATSIYYFGHRKDKGDLEKDIDKKITAFINKGNSSGISIGIYKNGKVFFKGYGTTETGKTILPDSNTVFELASTSKLFTTITLQILVDSGLIKIDDKIQSILAKVDLPPIAQNTTLQHLATHLSGFPNIPNSFFGKFKDSLNPYKDLVREDMYEYLRSCSEKQSEGTYEYSNFGMGLLGHLLELKAGMKYEELVKKLLLTKLNMSNTFVTVDSINKKKIIQGYTELGTKSPVWTDNVLTGAGSFLSCTSDMVKFIKANLNENASIVSKSIIKTHAPQLNGEGGLGWMYPSIETKVLGNNTIIWHNGMAGGYTSFLAIDKTNNYGIILLSNKATELTALGMQLTNDIKTQSWKQ